MTAQGRSGESAPLNGAVTVTVNGEALDATPDANGYIAIRRAWKHGDSVRLDLPMTTRVWQSHPKVPENRGRIALSRGPVLYCVEHADLPGVYLDELYVDPERIETQWREEHLGGVVVLKGTARKREIASDWSASLYRPLKQTARAAQDSEAAFVAIPYFAWHNRESGPMKVWLNYRGE